MGAADLTDAAAAEADAIIAAGDAEHGTIEPHHRQSATIANITAARTTAVHAARFVGVSPALRGATVSKTFAR